MRACFIHCGPPIWGKEGRGKNTIVGDGSNQCSAANLRVYWTTPKLVFLSFQIFAPESDFLEVCSATIPVAYIGSTKDLTAPVPWARILSYFTLHVLNPAPSKPLREKGIHCLAAVVDQALEGDAVLLRLEAQSIYFNMASWTARTYHATACH